MSKYIYNDWDDDFVPKYRSKKKKTTKKSSHKHEYERIIGEVPHSYGEGYYYVLAKECKVCGKLEVVEHFLSVKIEGKPYRRLFPTKEEVIDMFPDYRIVRLQSRG